MKKLSILGLVMMLMAQTLVAQITNPAPYCNYDFSSTTPVVTGGITNVTLGTLTNVTNPGTTSSLYTYYNNLTPPVLTVGNTYTINLTFNGSTTDSTAMYGAVYVDFNGDGAFQPAEMVWNQGNTPLPVGAASSSITIPVFLNVPLTAVPGITRMRVIRFEDNIPNTGAGSFIPNYILPACNIGTGTYSHKGEVEDYDIDIQSGAATPTIITAPATAVTMTDATLNGGVNMNNLGTGTISFEWGLTTAYGNGAPATPNIATGNTLVPVSSTLAGVLTPGTLYHYRVVVIDGNNVTHYGNDQTFVTVALPTPLVNTIAPINITTSSATLRGNANMNGVAGFGALEIEYGLTTAYGNNLIGSPASATGTNTVSFTSNATLLTPNTTYHYRAKLTEGGNVYYGADMTFTTLPLPDPVIFTNPATNILEDEANLNGLVNALDLGTGIIGFQYGTTTAYGSTVGGNPGTISGSISTPFTAKVTGLTPSTDYHFRAFVTINGQTFYGIDQIFTTRDRTLPNVSTLSATNISTNGVQLHGFINPQNFGTCILDFEWGSTPALGNTISANPNIVSGDQLVGVQAYLNSTFTPGSTYYYRLIADINGTFYAGTILTFTLDWPTAVEVPETGVALYPNPATDQIIIKTDDPMQSITIYDMIGRPIQQIAGQNLKEQKLNIQTLPPGVYMIKVLGLKDTYQQNFSKK